MSDFRTSGAAPDHATSPATRCPASCAPKAASTNAASCALGEDVEHGERNVSLANILKIAEALGGAASTKHERAEHLLNQRR